MRPFLQHSLLLILCLALVACGTGSTTGTPVVASPSPYQPLERTPTAVSRHATPSAAPAFTPDNLPVSTVHSLQEEAEFVVELCSPLFEHALAELPEIVSDPYKPPPMGSDARHQGVDFSYYRRGERASILGVGVQSVFAGRGVASISDSFPYGNMVIVETSASDLPKNLAEQLGIEEGESLYTLYAHLGAAPLVALGEAVSACQPIGEVGKSGNAGVPHLHLEMRIGPENRQLASMAFYSTQTTQEERDNYVLWRMSGEFRPFDPMSVLAP